MKITRVPFFCALIVKKNNALTFRVESQGVTFLIMNHKGSD